MSDPEIISPDLEIYIGVQDIITGSKIIMCLNDAGDFVNFNMRFEALVMW